MTAEATSHDRPAEPAYRAGFACLVGRPNAGKSTLTNALVGQKVAITSSKPQTTRHTIRGIVTRPTSQLILVDTPGLHKPRTLLGERLNDLVRETLLDVDVVGFCLPADQRVGPRGPVHRRRARRAAAGQAQNPSWRSRPRVTGVDASGCRAPHRRRPAWGLGRHRALLGDPRRSGRRGAHGARRPPAAVAAALSRRGAHRRARDVMIAELVREAALEGCVTSCRTRWPWSSRRSCRARTAEGLTSRCSTCGSIVFVERDSQKAIVIGRGGARLREVGTNARAGIEGARVEGPPRPARQGRQGLAARSEAAQRLGF
jgi:GTP-binding protein Era